ncbi:MAG TPA: aldo/keto reductase [Casimicrobiaceae bacterium]|nr:aldo/keto reductase [Casimicrobiaceae bacterium]
MPVPPQLRSVLGRAPLALGGAPLGNLFKVVTETDAAAVIAAARAGGIDYFDTAPHYGHGLSEQRFGRALRGAPRDAFVLSTKVGRLLSPSANVPRVQHGYVDGLPFVQRYDYSYDGTLRSLDDSLDRLGLGRIDIAYVHDIDVETHGSEQPARFRETIDGALPALAQRKAEGTLAAYGLGVNDVQVCLDTLAVADIDIILLAGRYTLADQSALPALLPRCTARRVAIVAGGPFNSGILATGSRPRDGSAPYFNYAPASPEVIDRIARIEAVCAEFDVVLKAAALQFPRAHPAVACVLVGARSVAELADNLLHARLPIPRAFWAALRERGFVDAAAPLPGDV